MICKTLHKVIEMAKGSQKLYLGIAIVAILVCASIAAFWFLSNTGYAPPGNFQVQVEGWLREDLGSNAAYNGHEVDVYRDGGATYVETVTSAATGKLEFSFMYWIGETITLQVRTAAYDGSTFVHNNPYIMSPVDVVIPASAEPGDTVAIGTIWGRDASDKITLVCTDQAGNSVADNTGLFLNDSTDDDELRVLLTACDSGEGWGAEDEVTDLRTGDVFVGAIVVFKTDVTQAISNYKWHISTGSYQYYVLQPGRFADDPNIPDDGTAECVFHWNAAITATTSIVIDAYDVEKYADMMSGVFGSYDLDDVNAITTKAA